LTRATTEIWSLHDDPHATSQKAENSHKLMWTACAQDIHRALAVNARSATSQGLVQLGAMMTRTYERRR